MQKLVQQRMKMLEGMPRLIGPMSVKISDVPTGTWRYHRPVIRHDDCVKCGICAEYCPCGVIEKIDNKMVIDYTYCKGCGICYEKLGFEQTKYGTTDEAAMKLLKLKEGK